MKKVFNMFDQTKSGFVETSKFVNILSQLTANVDEFALEAKIEEVDAESESIDVNPS